MAFEWLLSVLQSAATLSVGAGLTICGLKAHSIFYGSTAEAKTLAQSVSTAVGIVQEAKSFLAGTQSLPHSLFWGLLLGAVALGSLILLSVLLPYILYKVSHPRPCSSNPSSAYAPLSYFIPQRLPPPSTSSDTGDPQGNSWTGTLPDKALIYYGAKQMQSVASYVVSSACVHTWSWSRPSPEFSYPHLNSLTFKSHAHPLELDSLFSVVQRRGASTPRSATGAVVRSAPPPAPFLLGVWGCCRPQSGLMVRGGTAT